MPPNGAILKNLKEVRVMLNFLLWKEWEKSTASTKGVTYEQWLKAHCLPVTDSMEEVSK